MLKYLVILALCFSICKTVTNCDEFDDLPEDKLWEAVRPTDFQTYFIISFGSLSVIGLIFTIATWKIYPSFSVPSDIMFAICISQLLENSSLVISTIYFLVHKSQLRPPPDFAATCTSVSVIFAIGNSSSTLYNVVFCAILSLSIRKPLKGSFFNQYRYHGIVILAVLSITLSLGLTEALGTGLNGICGYKLQDRQSFARFSVQILIVLICLFSMYMFSSKVPKSSYFKRASIFGFYYYYMGFYSVVQILSTLGYLIGNIACRSGSSFTAEIISISITFGSCVSIVLSFVLMGLRFSHPLVRMNIKKIFRSKKANLNISEENENEYVWLGQLVQSIKGSQIISFLSGVLISFAEHEHKVKHQSQILKFSFKKNYVIKLNEDITEQYMIKKASNRESYIIKQKLGGLKALQYEVTTYAIEVFTQMISGIKDGNIFQSFNINQNIGLVKQKAYSDGGKSGQFMFGTFDNKFIIKTITEDEAMLYLQKIRDFYEYFKENPHTMITKILGLYKFERRDVNEEPVYIILMKNVSPYDRKFQQRVYDIKGSEFNRSTIQEKNIQSPEKLRNHTLKDVDFKKLQQRICIEPSDAQVLRRQLKRDADFLGRMSVMDYSILIIKRKGKMRTREENVKPIAHNQFHSYASLDQYYNIGIIDYLESWTLRRKAERAFKTMITKKKVTVTSPEEYSSRLSHFIDEII